MAFLSQSLKNQSLESSCSATKESVTWELGAQALTSNSGASASNGNSGTPFLKNIFYSLVFRERRRENIDLLFHPFMHSLVDAHMCPNQD